MTKQADKNSVAEFFGKVKSVFSNEDKHKKENFSSLLITDKDEIESLVKKIENQQLIELKRTVEQLAEVINKLIMVQKESVEFIVQTATAVQEFENLLDNKTILITDSGVDPSSIFGTVTESSRKTPSNIVDLIEMHSGNNRNNNKKKAVN